MNDLDIIDAAVKFISDFGKDDLMPHFIYCGIHYIYPEERREKLKKMILTKMRKYEIQSEHGILTILNMGRWNLMTKEKVKRAAEGYFRKYYVGSINDDLEKFLINLQNQKEVKDEFVKSFFLPKLTNEELKLVQERNEEHLKTYYYHRKGENPDVDDEEMKKSESKSKYVQGQCQRWTIALRLETKENEDQT